jgi:hypothetical protein
MYTTSHAPRARYTLHGVVILANISTGNSFKFKINDPHYIKQHLKLKVENTYDFYCQFLVFVVRRQTSVATRLTVSSTNEMYVTAP